MPLTRGRGPRHKYDVLAFEAGHVYSRAEFCRYRVERTPPGGAMRACQQCGLSISDTATFCAVCGARFDASVSTAPPVSTAAPSAPPPSTTPPSTTTPPPTAGAFDPPTVQSGAGLGQSLGQSAEQDDAGLAAPENAASRRRRGAVLPAHEAGQHEKSDPRRAAELYRDAILLLLESAADPLDHKGVRHDLLFIFDRLSLLLKRQGPPIEALEEIECAASLGLLDCRDYGVKGHREALRKRRESLQRALEAQAPPVT